MVQCDSENTLSFLFSHFKSTSNESHVQKVVLSFKVTLYYDHHNIYTVITLLWCQLSTLISLSLKWQLTNWFIHKTFCLLHRLNIMKHFYLKQIGLMTCDCEEEVKSLTRASKAFSNIWEVFPSLFLKTSFFIMTFWLSLPLGDTRL